MKMLLSHKWEACWKYEETEDGFYSDTKVFELTTADVGEAREQIQVMVGTKCPIIRLRRV